MESIWEYSESNIDLDKELFNIMSCLFCNTLLKKDEEVEKRIVEEEFSYGMSDGFRTKFSPFIGICPACGWWKYAIHKEWAEVFKGYKPPNEYILKYGILKKMNVSDINIPIEEVKKFLITKYESRFNVHPKFFENIVASVFKNFGYTVNVTAYSGDGGIDVILENQQSQIIGVQVKRYRNSISVDQIREFTGSLVLQGITKGIFVTTSGFQSGADSTAHLSSLRGFPIELVDAKKFYDVLKLSQIKSYSSTKRKPWER